jgi:hypothetical protein
MRLTKLLPVLAFCAFACDTAQNVEPRYRSFYAKFYGGEGDQSAADVHVNQDGTMMLLGNSLQPSGITTSFLVKVDPLGEVIWERQVGGDNEVAVDIELITRGPYLGGYIIAANAADGTNSRIRLIRINTSGTGIDSVLVDLHSQEGKQRVKSITCLNEGDGYVVTGEADRTLTTESTPGFETTDERDILAFRFDDSLILTDTLVSKGGERNGSGVKIFELGSGNPQLVLFSYTDRPYLTGTFNYNFSYDLLINGVPVGSIVGDETQEETLADVIKTPFVVGEGFLLAGTSVKKSNGSGDLYLVKINSTLEHKSLDKKLLLDRNLECVAAGNAPGGYYILSNEHFDGGHKNIVLIKTGFDGVVEWTKSFGSAGTENSAAAISVLPDGRIALVGTMELKTRKKLALIVVNSTGDF